MERDTVPFTVYEASDDPLRHAFRNVDDMDWWHLERCLPDSGHGRFWKAVLKEARAALAAND